MEYFNFNLLQIDGFYQLETLCIGRRRVTATYWKYRTGPYNLFLVNLRNKFFIQL